MEEGAQESTAVCGGWEREGEGGERNVSFELSGILPAGDARAALRESV